jgi:hypothetical protein
MDGAGASRTAVVAAALSVGALATLIPRYLDLATCDPSCGSPSTLHAPLYAGLTVFVASSLGLVLYQAGDPGQKKAGAPNAPTASHLLKILLLPAVFNVAGTVSQLAAMLYIPAAVLAGMRGVLILLTALFSTRLGLADAPKGGREWVLVALSAVGAAAVGGAAVGSGDGDSSPSSSPSSSSLGPSLGASASTAVGLALCTLGYTLASAQVAIEARTLDSGISRWAVLGVEGIYGVVIVILLMVLVEFGFPGNGLEVPSHTLCCVNHSPAMVGLSVGYGASSLTFNALLLTLSSLIGPNLRVFVFTARGAITWVVETVMFFVAGADYGTRLSGWSALELAGFFLLIGAGAARAKLQAERAAAAVGAPKQPAVRDMDAGDDDGGLESATASLLEAGALREEVNDGGGARRR